MKISTRNQSLELESLIDERSIGPDWNQQKKWKIEIGEEEYNNSKKKRKQLFPGGRPKPDT